MTALVRTPDTAEAAPHGVVALDMQSRFLRSPLPTPKAANDGAEAPSRPSILVARRTRQRRRMDRN